MEELTCNVLHFPELNRRIKVKRIRKKNDNERKWTVKWHNLTPTSQRKNRTKTIENKTSSTGEVTNKNSSESVFHTPNINNNVENLHSQQNSLILTPPSLPGDCSPNEIISYKMELSFLLN